MVNLAELQDYLIDFLQVDSFKDYCPNGLQIEGQHEIEHIAMAVSASLETIQEAAALNVEALIVHHGMFWQGDDYTIKGVKKQKIEILLENQISLLGYHLPLDAHPEIGNNWKAAECLQWRNLEPFGEFGGAAIGVKGSFPEMEIEEFRGLIENYYQQKAHVALGGSSKVSTAALVSGGAYKLISQAAKEDVDCFITGNFDEPAWHMAHEGGVNFFAVGHSASERTGPKALGKHLEEKFGVKYTFIDSYNPF